MRTVSLVGRSLTAVLLAVAGFAALAGCSGSSVGDESSTSVLPSSSPSGSTASVAEYASLLARQRGVVVAALSSLEPCAGDRAGPTRPAGRTCTVVETRAGDLDRALERAGDGHADDYLGLPPGDIAALLAATRAAAQDARTAARAAARCPTSCADEMAAAVAAAHDLESELDAWATYR